MNKGDTIRLVLNYKVNDEPLAPDTYDEIELQLNSQTNANNSVKLLLSQGQLVWDTELMKYTAFLSQQDTFKLKQGALNIDSDIDYQLRILKSGTVISSDVGMFTLGPVLSRKILEVV